MGVTGTSMVGLGVHHVLTHLDHMKNRVIHYFSPCGGGFTPTIINRGTLDLPLVLSEKVKIGPQNPYIGFCPYGILMA